MKSQCREGAVCSKSSRRWLASPYHSDALVVDWEHEVVSRGVFARMGSWPGPVGRKSTNGQVGFCRCSLAVEEIVFRTGTGCSRLCSNQGDGRHNARWQGHRAKGETLSCEATVIFVLLVYASLLGSFPGFRRLPSCLRWDFSRQGHDLLFVRNFLPWWRTSSLCTAGLGGACISWSTFGHPWQQRILMSLCGADVSFVAAAKAQARCIKSAADTWDRLSSAVNQSGESCTSTVLCWDWLRCRD